MTTENKRFSLPNPESHGSNMPLLLIASAFLFVTIVLALLQPGLDSSRSETDLAGTPVPNVETRTSVQPTTPQDVTRTQVPLLNQPPEKTPPTYRTTAARITNDLVAAPVNVDAQTDLTSLSRAVVAQFSPNEDPDRLLVALIVESIQQRQSDAYFNVLLNTAAARDRFAVPMALRTASGGIDSATLLHAIASAAGGPADATIQTVNLSGTHIVGAGDSLAGIAQRYYGRPEAYPVIVDANPALLGQNLRLTDGTELQLPQG